LQYGLFVLVAARKDEPIDDRWTQPQNDGSEQFVDESLSDEYAVKGNLQRLTALELFLELLPEFERAVPGAKHLDRWIFRLDRQDARHECPHS
jgi:hypothetical protein